MNDEQGARLNKLLKTIGYIISGGVVWMYISRRITPMLIPDARPYEWIGMGVVLIIALAILGVIGAVLYLWVKAG